MNYSTAIFLIDPSVRAIAVTYEKIDMDQDTTKQMKYQSAYLSGGNLPKGATIFKTLDQDIEVGHFVIVPTDTRHGMTVCKVVAVDVSSECHWIVGTVHTFDFESIRQQEEAAIMQIKKKEVAKRREELSNTLRSNIGDDIPRISLAPVTQPINEETPAPAPIQSAPTPPPPLAE